MTPDEPRHGDGVLVSRRHYSAEELHALRKAKMLNKGEPGRGPAYYACGPYWPAELERQADEAERLIPELRLAARALRREMLRWPTDEATR